MTIVSGVWWLRMVFAKSYSSVSVGRVDKSVKKAPCAMPKSATAGSNWSPHVPPVQMITVLDTQRGEEHRQ